MATRKILAPTIGIRRAGTNAPEMHAKAVLRIEKDAEGRISNVDIENYDGESAGVEYYGTPVWAVQDEATGLWDVRDHKLYGLIGRPLAHSFSSRWFNERFAMASIAARYDNFELPAIGNLEQVLEQHPELAGFNVTSPYKRDVMAFLDEVSEEAQAVNAVNTVVRSFDKDGRQHLKGHNTDIAGFRRLAEKYIGEKHMKALVLGTGGASDAVTYALLQLGVEVTHVSRRSGEGRLSYEQLDVHTMEAHDMVVNATPLGMHPHEEECPAIPYEHIGPRHVCIDLIYNPAETIFLRRCRQQGATTANGLLMLTEQAREAARLWNLPIHNL